MDKKINNTPSVDTLMKLLTAQRDTIDRLRENYDELSKKYSNLYDENERMHNKLKL